MGYKGKGKSCFHYRDGFAVGLNWLQNDGKQSSRLGAPFIAILYSDVHLCTRDLRIKFLFMVAPLTHIPPIDLHLILEKSNLKNQVGRT